MIGRIVESFFSKIGEQLADYSQQTISNIKDFNSNTIDSLQRNLTLLIAKKFDVEEQIKNAELSGKKKRKREVENWLTQVQLIESEFLELENEVHLEGFIITFLAGDRVAKLSERVEKLVKQSRHFGELVLDVYQTTRGEVLLTAKLVGEAFEKNLEKIWEMLMIDKLSSIGIHGMGGVGKTTLTKHIHNKLIEKTQECVFWVTVSDELSVKMLQDKIAHAMGFNLSDRHDEDKRAAILNQELSIRKNVVLILDDLWAYINLEKVGDPLCVEGCRLIITTRSSQLCDQMLCRQKVEVKTLHENEAWNLFTETLGQETTLDPQVQEIAKSMVKMCDGLPLAIITLAGSMRGETRIHRWRNELVNLKESIMGRDEMEDNVFRVLEYSFDRLDPNHQREVKSRRYTSLQLCFLCCSFYPEDYKINREKLVRKFISEELVDKRKRRGAQIDEGHSILDKLVSVSLLESNNDIVKMHDLVRAMALKVTKGQNMVKAGHSLREVPDEEEWTKDLERVSLMKNRIDKIQHGMSPNCPNLSTLILNRNPLKFLPDTFFSKIRRLCNLDLSETDIKELPNSMSDLENLKVLILSGCENLVHVPDLGKLKALRELDLSDTALEEPPQGMEKLVNLKRLSMFRMTSFHLEPSFLLNFPHIQCLHLPLQIEAPVDEIEMLKELEEFEGRVKDVRDFNRFIRATQKRVSNTCYKIQIGSTADDHWSYGGRYSEVLIFYQYDLKKGDVNMLAQDIQRLVFRECDGLSNSLLDDLPNNATSICTLGIINCDGIECIQTGVNETKESSVIQSLEEIDLWDLPDFICMRCGKEISSPPRQHAVFSSLRRLSISGCHKMKKLGLPISEFPNLEYIYIGWCMEIQVIVSSTHELVSDESGDQALIKRTLPKLKHLSLIQLPALKSICKAPMICGSIETIELKKCPALNKVDIFQFSPSPAALKEIKLLQREKDWWESLEWDHPSHLHLLQPFIRYS